MKKKITILILVAIIIFAIPLVGCINRNYSSGSFPKAQKRIVKAIAKGDLASVQELAYSTDLEVSNSEGQSLLKIAMYEAYVNREDKSFEVRVNIVSELIKAGADPQNYSGPGYSPYGLATTMLAQDEVWRLKAFLEGDMSPNILRGSVPIISDVIIHLDEDITALKLLVEYGADVNIRGKSAFAPLFGALAMRKACAALYLVENGADTDIVTDDYSIPWSVYRAEKDLFDGTALDRYDYLDKTLEQRQAYIEKEKEAIVILKEILIDKGHTWPPEEPERIRKNREKNEQRAEERRLYEEKYYPSKRKN